MAVVVQVMVKAELSGVLFTVDPVHETNSNMIGNFVYGLGESLVSGESNAETFKIDRVGESYDGPPALSRYYKEFLKLGTGLERDLGFPQDIEWSISGGKLFILQSRPITTLKDYDQVMGQWNDSLKGDFLWSSCNAGEAIPDVMTPLTWSIWEIFHEETPTIKFPKGYSLQGIIGGRSYFNYSLFYWLMRPLMDEKKSLIKTEEFLGVLPKGVDIPKISFTKSDLFKMILSSIRWKKKYKEISKEIPIYLASNQQLCQDMEEEISKLNTSKALYSFWQQELKGYLLKSFWIMRAGSKPALDILPEISSELKGLVGSNEASVLLSNLGKENLSSLGPLVGISRVASNNLSKEEYMKEYGHRGPHEAELSIPRPIEEPEWLQRQVEHYTCSLNDIEKLLERQRKEFEKVWKEFEDRYPLKVDLFKGKIHEASRAARIREAVRSETIRAMGLVRKFCMRAGEVSKLQQDIFFLTIGEICQVLSGKEDSLRYINSRKGKYSQYCQLPKYPVFIKGKFDPHQWASNPQRRSDIYDDNTQSTSLCSSTVITGFSGSVGRIEGLVRKLEKPEDGQYLNPGEVLVTSTTNIGWTPVFPKACAIVTDIGAPLSHAAIVARELGVPAVVGCRNATMVLNTGDRVIVDGGKGTVEIISRSCSSEDCN